ALRALHFDVSLNAGAVKKLTAVLKKHGLAADTRKLLAKLGLGGSKEVQAQRAVNRAAHGRARGFSLPGGLDSAAQRSADHKLAGTLKKLATEMSSSAAAHACATTSRLATR